MGTKRGQRRITYGRGGTPTKTAFTRRRRRGASPQFKKLTTQLASQRKSNRALRGRIKGGNFTSGSGLKLQATGAIIAGGAAAGAVEGMRPMTFGFPTGVVVGAGLVASGLMISKTMENLSGVIGCLGSGMLAAHFYAYGRALTQTTNTNGGNSQ